jgi:hypothetical protein
VVQIHPQFLVFKSGETVLAPPQKLGEWVERAASRLLMVKLVALLVGPVSNVQ